MKRISFFLIVVFFISACSMSSIGLSKKATATPAATEVAATEGVPTDVVATDVAQATDTEVVAPTAEALATDTPAVPTETAVLVTDTPEPPADTATPEMEAWRIPVMPGTQFVANEKKSDPTYDSMMAAQATNLAVAQPYYWDIYSIAPGTRYRDVQTYFIPTITQTGFQLSLDVQGANEVYLEKFTKKQSKSQIYVQYDGTTPQRKTPFILIFYSNP